MSIYQAFLFAGVLQGLFLVAALWLKNARRRHQNLYFLCLISLITLSLSMKLLYTPERYLIFPQIWYVADLVAYLVGPFWYFTIRKSIAARIKISPMEWALLAPIGYYVFFLIYLFSIPTSSVLAGVDTLWTISPYYLFCGSVLLVNGAFLIKAHHILRNVRNTRFPKLLINGQYAMLMIIGLWMICFLVGVLWTSDQAFSEQAYQYAFLSLAFLLFGFAFLALIKPESFYFLTQTFDTNEHFVLQQLAHQIKTYLDTEKPFLKSGFSLNDLSEAVSSNPVLTSKAINHILKTNYADLMNSCRLDHFLQMAQQQKHQHLTHWALAQEAGFGNKVSFYKYFRKNFGTTPKVYLATLKGSKQS